MIPYVTPYDLLGDPSAPPSVTAPSEFATLGFNPSRIALSRLWQMCWTATTMVDGIAAQTLRGQSFYEENFGPGHRLGILANGIARFVTSRKPILSVVAAQGCYGGPPWQWNPIPTANVVLETPVFTDFGSAGWEAADPGQAALLISGTGGWAAGRLGLRVGVTYLCGWPVCGLEPAAASVATFTANENIVTVGDATGYAVGAPVISPFLPAETTIEAIDDTTLSLSAPAVAPGSGALLAGYPAGVTTINVDDIATWTLGIRGTIYDGLNTESAVSVSVDGANLTPTPVGPGTITLASPTIWPHIPGVAFSAMPSSIRWATMLAVKIQALERGATAVTAAGTPGRSSNSGGSSIARTTAEIQRLILPYRRVW